MTRRIEIEGRTYELRPWSTTDGEPMAFRLLRILVTSGVDANDGEFAGVLEHVKDRDFDDLRALAVKYTDIVELDASGEELVRPLSKSREDLQGRYQDLLALVLGHLTHEFGPFFSSLPTVLGSVVGKKAKTAGR